MKDSEKLKNVYKKFRRVKNKMVRNFPVVSIEEIKLTAKIKRRMDSFSKKRADENAKKIRVHKFFYKSGGHNVVGFLDRKSVVPGKSVDLGGRRIIKKK